MANEIRNVIANAFSLSMISHLIWDEDSIGNDQHFAGYSISIKEVPPEALPENLYSVIGHPDTARVVGNILHQDIPFNRETYTAQKGDVLYVAQYAGPRLPEGATQLPDGASIRFYRIMEVSADLGDNIYEVPFRAWDNEADWK